MNEKGTGQLALRFPRISDHQLFETARAECRSSTTPFAFGYDERTEFKDYLQLLQNYRHGTNLPRGHVPALFLLAEVDGVVVGRISLRLALTKALRRYGGHVGYVVRPKFRCQGYGKEMLRQIIIIAKALGFHRLLVCTSPTNEASVRVISACGGIYGGEVRYDDGMVRHRYWLSCMDTQAPASNVDEPRTHDLRHRFQRTQKIGRGAVFD